MSVTPTKEEKKRIMDKVPTRTMSYKQWGEVLGWTHSEAKQGIKDEDIQSTKRS